MAILDRPVRTTGQKNLPQMAKPHVERSRLVVEGSGRYLLNEAHLVSSAEQRDDALCELDWRRCFSGALTVDHVLRVRKRGEHIFCFCLRPFQPLTLGDTEGLPLKMP